MVNINKTEKNNGSWVFEKIGFLPYNLVEKNENKIIRKIGLLFCLIWLPIVVTPFIPYLIYKMLEDILDKA